MAENTDGPTVVDLEQLDKGLNTLSAIRIMKIIIQKAVTESVPEGVVESNGTNGVVRFLYGGALYTVMAIASEMYPLVVDQLKRLVGMNSEEHRTVQTGECSVRHLGKDVLVKMTTEPTKLGEKIHLKFEPK